MTLWHGAPRCLNPALQMIKYKMEFKSMIKTRLVATSAFRLWSQSMFHDVCRTSIET